MRIWSADRTPENLALHVQAKKLSLAVERDQQAARERELARTAIVAEGRCSVRYFDPALGRFVEQEDDAPAVSRDTEGPLAEAHAIERDAEFRAFLKEAESSESESAASFAKLLAKHRRSAEYDSGAALDKTVKAVTAKGAVVEFRRPEEPTPRTRREYIGSSRQQVSEHRVEFEFD